MGTCIEAAVYEVRPCNFTDKTGHLVKLWSCRKVTLSSQLHLSYFSSFMLRNAEHKKQHSIICAVKNNTTLVLTPVNAELITRMELHVHSCYFSPLTAAKVAVRLLFSVDQSKHGFAVFRQTTVASETQRRVWLSQIMPVFPACNPLSHVLSSCCTRTLNSTMQLDTMIYQDGP